MESLMQVATRHMVAGVMDLDELAALCAHDFGRAPSREALSGYRSRFRKHGTDWIDTWRRTQRRWKAENPGKSLKATNPVKSLYLSCRSSAKRRGFECCITEADVRSMTASMRCSVTDLPLAWSRPSQTTPQPWAPSIDRIDSAEGYLPGNVRVVCWAYNQARSDFPDEVVSSVASSILNPRPGDPARRADPMMRAHGCRPAMHLHKSCRRSAKRRGHECTITVEMIEEMLAPMTCSVTGLPLTWAHPGGSSRDNPWAPSIDRLDNAIGYVPGNVRLVCWAFNKMRSEWPDDVVLMLAKAVIARAP